MLCQHRSTQRKVPRGADDEQALTEDIIALAKQYGRYGYRRVTALLCHAGWRVTDQILYNLTRRGPEHDLLGWLSDHGMLAMAYSRVEQGRLLSDNRLKAIASDIGITPAQLALAWVLHRPGMIAIPKAGTLAHVRDNGAAADTLLSADILARLDAACFLACTFWMVDAWALLGERRKAEMAFDAAVGGLEVGVGIYPEMIDPDTGHYLGNMPQGLTHLAAVQAMMTLYPQKEGRGG